MSYIKYKHHSQPTNMVLIAKRIVLGRQIHDLAHPLRLPQNLESNTLISKTHFLSSFLLPIPFASIRLLHSPCHPPTPQLRCQQNLLLGIKLRTHHTRTIKIKPRCRTPFSSALRFVGPVILAHNFHERNSCLTGCVLSWRHGRERARENLALVLAGYSRVLFCVVS
jgi:hypothetical protein